MACPQPTPPGDRATRRFDGATIVAVCLFLLFSAALFNSFRIDKHLSADGVNNLAIVIETHDFIRAGWGRQSAHCQVQWPLVLGVAAGVRDIPTLSWLYALGIYLPFLLSFAICLFALRGQNRSLLAFPLLSMVGIALSSDYMLPGAHNVMASLTWPILLLLLRRRALAWADGVLLWGLLLLFFRTYEPGAAPAVLFVLAAAIRLWRGPKRRTWKQRVILIGCLTLGMLVILASVGCVVNHHAPGNRASFVVAIIQQLASLEACVSLCFCVLITLAVVSRWKVLAIAFAIAALVPVALYRYYAVLFAPYGVSASVSFACRSLCVTLLPLLLVSAVATWYVRGKLGRIGWTVLAVFVATMVVGNLRFSSDWNDFRKSVTHVVTTEEGFVPIEKTGLSGNRCGWDWNNTQLGLVWSAPNVRAILLNAENLAWEPFDPRRQLILQEYLAYDERLRRAVPPSPPGPARWPPRRQSSWVQRAWERLFQ